ncbi:MAG: hypothetical protein EGR99_11090 [Faecalibacterium sp.]|nr:hypothetical protein [Faecalibacterium sp.]
MPAPPRGELLDFFRSAQIKLPLSGTTSPGGGKMAKPERGTAGEQSESERVRFAGISPIFSIDNRAKLAYITIVNTN